MPDCFVLFYDNYLLVMLRGLNGVSGMTYEDYK